jgi:hypothetical protein
MINIDGKEYDFDSLPIEAKKQLQMLQFIEAESVRLAAQSAILQTARIAYSKALQDALNPPAPAAPDPLAGGTIKFS